MKSFPRRWPTLLCGLVLFLEASRLLAAEPTPINIAAFNLYSRSVETRLAAQHSAAATFLAASSLANAAARARQGELLIEHLPTPAIPGAMLHHWRGTAFAPGATAADFERLMRDFNAYPRHFAPEVVSAELSNSAASPVLRASLRIRQHHVITVLMDTAYDVSFGQLDLRHGYSISRGTRIDELDPKTARTLTPDEAHGFLWRLNTYWSYEERDGGLYLQVESVSLTRTIPTGLGWAVKPYVESIPRESLEFTLRSAVNAMRTQQPTPQPLQRPALTAQRTSK